AGANIAPVRALLSQGGSMSRRRLTGLACVVVLSVAVVSGISAAGGGLAAIKSQDLKEWLSYIASDELEGREIYTTGIGLAAAYIEDHARAWGARPAGDKGRYLQTVRVLGVKATSHASVTVD